MSDCTLEAISSIHCLHVYCVLELKLVSTADGSRARKLLSPCLCQMIIEPTQPDWGTLWGLSMHTRRPVAMWSIQYITWLWALTAGMWCQLTQYFHHLQWIYVHICAYQPLHCNSGNLYRTGKMTLDSYFALDKEEKRSLHAKFLFLQQFTFLRSLFHLMSLANSVCLHRFILVATYPYSLLVGG